MNEKLIASFRIDITSVRECTWQGRVTCGAETRTFESELALLKYMIELAPELAPDVSWPDGDLQRQEDT